MDINVEIRTRDGGWAGLVRHPDERFTRTLGDLRLGPAESIPLKGGARTLGDLVRALVAYDAVDLAFAFDERGQSAIGDWLYRQLFGDQPLGADEVRLQIDTDDEHIAALPWPLLCREGVFCCANGWSVALGGGARRGEVRLPPAPRLLLIMPEPTGLPTQAAAHLEELETHLSAGLPTLRQGRQLRVARTWEECLTQCRDFAPELVYYYGHGLAHDQDSTRLVFADAQGRRVDRPVADLPQVLGNLETRPLLADINCCRGDAGGLLGAGRQLARWVPAVVTNRTVAMIPAARGQALALWDALLLKGESPHRAIATLYARRIGPDLSFADARWLTPVLHTGYQTWQAAPSGVRAAADHDPYWHLKIDRVSPFATVATDARRMLREGRPRCHAFVWYGRAGEGVDLFHTRLNVDLDDGQFLLVGISFVVEKPLRFQKAMQQDGLLDLSLEGTVFHLLDELERLALKDLLRFVQTHRIHHVGRLDEARLRAVLDDTDGHYEQTVEVLRSLLDRPWAEPAAGPATGDHEEYDY